MCEPVDCATVGLSNRARLAAETDVPGLLLVPQALPVGEAIRQLELVCVASEQSDWVGIIEFLPL